MAIQMFSAAEVAAMDLEVSPQRSKYPWYTTKKGDSFFVPRTDYNREDYRLNTPPKLRNQGWKFTCRAVTIPTTKQKGLLVTRVS
jgi:hypothetical protein